MYSAIGSALRSIRIQRMENAAVLHYKYDRGKDTSLISCEEEKSLANISITEAHEFAEKEL